MILIDPVGGQAEKARITDISPTLKASHYKFPPVVLTEKDGKDLHDYDEHLSSRYGRRNTPVAACE